MSETSLAWLAGLWDGEGSVGLNYQGKGLTSRVQICMTDSETIIKAQSILIELGVRGLGYIYQEKQPWHKPAHHLRINRAWDQRIMARALVPYAVTKRRQWEALLTFLERRLDGVKIDDLGRVVRGGSPKWWKPYVAEDWLTAEHLADLNRRASCPVPNP